MANPHPTYDKTAISGSRFLCFDNDQIAELPKKVKNTSFASSDGLKAYDRWHFETASANLLGKRYAEAMLELLKK